MPTIEQESTNFWCLKTQSRCGARGDFHVPDLEGSLSHIKIHQSAFSVSPGIGGRSGKVMSPISRPTTDRSPSLELDCDHRTQHQQGRLTGLSSRNVAQPKGKRPGVQSKPNDWPFLPSRALCSLICTGGPAASVRKWPSRRREKFSNCSPHL